MLNIPYVSLIITGIAFTKISSQKLRQRIPRKSSKILSLVFYNKILRKKLREGRS